MRALMILSVAAFAAVLPSAVSACTVPPRPMTEAEIDYGRQLQSEMWRDATLVYLAEVTGTVDDPTAMRTTMSAQPFMAEARQLLKGDALPTGPVELISGGRACARFTPPPTTIGERYVVYVLPDGQGGERRTPIWLNWVRDPATLEAVGERQ